MSAAPVPLHPEVVADDPAALRWVVPPGTLSVRGRVTRAPRGLASFVEAGVVEDLVAEATAVTIRLTDGHTWRQEGASIRTALGEALSSPEEWEASERPVVGDDAALREAAEAVIAGEAGEYVRSHGGHIELAGVRDGCVEVRLTGACGHCPAAAATLRYRVEGALRRAAPHLVEVRQVP